ncbi:peroxiredoxin [Bordetella sp. 2513F-2]
MTPLSRIALAACLWAAVPAARAVLPVGAPAPDFRAPAALAGEPYTFDLAEARARGPVVLYFYPAAFTQGCSLEARSFAEAIPQYQALGATVVGMSGDDMDTLKRFSAADCAGKFPVAADADGAVMRSYDAASQRRPDAAQRVSYVISPEGRILYAYGDANPEHHVTRTLEALRAWKAGR